MLNFDISFRARPESLTLTIPRDQKTPFIWFDVNTPIFFDIFRVEGIDPEDPDEDIIYFKLNNSYLMSALGRNRKESSVEIILEKHEFTFFTVSIITLSDDDQEKEVEVKNRVPIAIVPRSEWQVYEPPYGKFKSDLQCKCPRFPIFIRFIETFKYAHNIRIILRRYDKTISIEANEDSTRHFSIFKNVDVHDYDIDEPYNGSTVSTLVEQKKISIWLHSILFPPSSIHMECLIQNNKHVKLFFRIGDEIMSNFVIASELDDEDYDYGDDDEDEVNLSDSQI